MKIIWAAVVMTIAAAPVAAQSKRTYYTDEKLAIMRSNVAKYDWARSQRDAAINAAERWADYDDEQLRKLVIPPQVPRTFGVHSRRCPMHSHEVPLYGWEISLDRPFKVKCPVGGEEYPSNDFAKFLESGMKDRSLLTGDYADDGWGWHMPGDKEKSNYWFVAYYAHFSMMRHVLPAIATLGQAALLTEDQQLARKYAHQCAVLLWQMAVYYPDYDYSKQSREGKERNPNYTGKWTNMIWEVRTPNACAPAYDAVRPFLYDDVALQKLSGKSGPQLDEMIRERLLMEAARCITDGSHRIAGNYGMHQKSLVLLALALDEKQKHPTSQEMINYVVANPDVAGSQDLGLRDALESLVYRDGMPPESINYNGIWLRDLSAVAESLTTVGINYYKNRRFQKLLAWPFSMYVVGQGTPMMGDRGGMFLAGPYWRAGTCRAALKHHYDPRMAWVVKAQGASAGGDLFSEAPEEVLAQLPEQEPPPIGVNSIHLPGYGVGILQSGSDANRTASCLVYGAHPSHAHYDQLNLLLISQENVLLTEIGYAGQTDSYNPIRFGFANNTIAHNTVVVDAVKQSRRQAGKVRAFEPNSFAQVADASCESAYPGRVTLYRRANIHMQVTDTQSYLFDVFYVRGGKQHDYAAHGTHAECICDPPLGPVQPTGTLAGPDVPYEQFYDDAKLKDKKIDGITSFSGYRGSGFQYLTNVQRASLDGRAVCEWRLTEPLPGERRHPWKGIGLRAHIVGDDEQLFACDGPVQYPPKTVKFMIRRRTGEDLASNFVTVYEPYKEQPWIARVVPVAIEPDDEQAVAVQVELADGARHYVFHALNIEQTYTLDGRITVAGQAACLALDRNGVVDKAMLLNGTVLSTGDFTLKGKGLRRSRIVAVDYDSGVVEIADPVLGEDLRPGQTVLVEPDGFADCLTLQKVMDGTHFSIGDEEVLVAGGSVKQVMSDKSQMISNFAGRHAQPGMMMLNARGEPVGRVAAMDGKTWTLDRAGMAALTMNDFPTADNDPLPRYAVVIAAPGDKLAIPHLAVYAR